MTSTSPLLRAEALTREFDGEPAIEELDLDVHRGEIHAVVGLNGAGKTTLMRLLLGMLKPDAGRAIVLGFDAAEAPSEVWSESAILLKSPSRIRS